MKVWNIGVYLRLSVDDGEINESNSIINQKSFIDSFLQSKKEFIIYNYYIDDGYSGTNFERPSFKKMVLDIKEKNIDAIIVKDLSRFGRNYIETGKYIEDFLPLHNIRFISINDNIDSYENPETSKSIIVPIKNLMNDEYSRDISNKTKSVLDTKKKKGQFAGALAPYGYIKDPTNKNLLLIDNDASIVINKIFVDVINGKSKLEIIDYLNKEKILTPSAYRNQNKPSKRRIAIKWNTEMLDSILKNKVYTGTLIQNKIRSVSYKMNKQVRVPKTERTIVKNTHEAIISKKDFDLANKILYSTDIRVSENKSYDIFSGYLKCGDCGHNMRLKKTKKENTTYKYYYCNNYYLNKECSDHKTIGQELEDTILELINNQINIMFNIDNKLQDIKKIKKLNYNYEIKKNNLVKIKKKIAKIKLLLNELEIDYKENLLSKEDYMNYKKTYINELKELELYSKELNDENQIEKNNDDYHKILRKFKETKKIEKLTRKILNELVDTIYIKDGNRINVKFKYRDEYIAAIDFIKDTNNML